ncbi:MAG TPA: mechanosensitive ion channel family protein [Lacunisphaera sp.]
MPISNLTTRFMDYLPRLLEALPVAGIIIVGAWILNLLIGRAMSLVARRTRLTDMDVLPVRKILGWGVRIIALILILSVFGFQIGGIWAMLSTIFGLVAIGFVAVWSILSHTSATMLILFLHPFQVGDDVEFPGEPVKGRVIDINFFFTTVIDHDGMLCQIPNNLFFQKTLKRRKNEHIVSLAAQLNSAQPATVELPAAPASQPVGTVKEPDPNMLYPDPRSMGIPAKPVR